jgi:large repetitive protein
VINLKDILNGEAHDAASLVNYLHFNADNDKTTLYISSDGKFTNHSVGWENHETFLPQTTHIVEFIGVNLSQGNMTDAQIIQNLLSQKQLITD